MVYISKVYTKFGDGGETMLADGSTVPKHSLRVQAVGEVDELNSCIGLIRLAIEQSLGVAQDRAMLERVDVVLGRVQQELFDLGAELATPNIDERTAKLVIKDVHVARLEGEIDLLNDGLEPLRSFILPGGGAVGANAHLGRTVCRRAERRCLELAAHESVRKPPLIYLNRLSDYLFVLARAGARALDRQEVLWTPGQG